MLLRLGRDRTRQVEAVLEWLSGIAQPEDRILVEFPGYRRCFYFEFPLRFGDGPKIARRVPQGNTFTIRQPQPRDSLGELWVAVFISPSIEVWETRTRTSRTPPLRWGLSAEEKRIALKIAREALQKFLAGGERPSPEHFRNLAQRFYQRTDLDVALWTEGRLRGSQIIENRHLGEGIAEAAVSASRDVRFKPLSLEELDRTRIEVTLISPLRIPLSPTERERNLIYPEKGYVLEHGDRQGWFLPEIHNVRRFRILEAFLGELAHDKAGLPPASHVAAKVCIFEVDDFIDSADWQRALTLWGPIVKLEEETDILNQSNLLPRLRAAADWLCRIQEPDGNIPPITDPLSGRQTQIDWPRLAFAAWALAEFGKAAGEGRYTEAADKSCAYLRTHLVPKLRLQAPHLDLTLTYYGELCLSIGNLHDVATVAAKILSRLDQLRFEPIAFAQIASFLKRLSQEVAQSGTYFGKLAEVLRENFEASIARRVPMDLAAWAELVNVFVGVDQEFSEKVAEWLRSQQLPNGVFPQSTASDFAYTRGTGKVFEILSLGSGKHAETITRALRWLFSLQYDNENTFFVPKEVRPKIIGGFRHDYFNHETWIDAAGHLLLGGARMRKLYTPTA